MKNIENVLDTIYIEVGPGESLISEITKYLLKKHYPWMYDYHPKEDLEDE